MRSEEMDEAKGLPLFDKVATELVEKLLRASFLQRFPAHVELVSEGQPADFLHVIVEGRVEIFSAFRDRETTVSVLGPGATFILAAVITDRPYLKSARSLEPCRILLAPAELVRQVFSADGAFARNIALELARNYRAVVKELKNQKLRTAIERLAAWLLNEDERGAGNGSFDLPFEKKVLAARIGIAPEVLSRSFATLAKYHVDMKGRSIRLGDRAALARLAGPTRYLDDPNF